MFDRCSTVSVMPRPSSGHRRALGAAALAVVLAAASGCASHGQAVVDSAHLAEAMELLPRPLPGDFAALYSLRVARSGGLRLAVVTAGDEGRLTISEPFGGAVSLTAWSGRGPAVFFDMDEGCRREVVDLEEVLGVGALPLSQAVRLLGGRLPLIPGDEVVLDSGGAIEVRGAGWAARIRLSPQPWRVVEVSELGSVGRAGWHLELSSHASSVPGTIRLENSDGRWAELKLTRLEWPEQASLPELPVFERCAGW